MRALLWANLVLASLVVLGVFLQVYFIASYIFSTPGSGTAIDALDAHEDVGGIVHIIEVLVFLSAIGAYWRRWGEIALSFALPVVGTIQLSFSEGDDWVGGFHGLLALVVFVLAAVISHRAMRELGLRPQRPV